MSVVLLLSGMWHWGLYAEQWHTLFHPHKDRISNSSSSESKKRSSRSESEKSAKDNSAILKTWPYLKSVHLYYNLRIDTLVITFTVGKAAVGLPGVRLMASVLIRCDGWLSTSSNMGRPPLQLDNCKKKVLINRKAHRNNQHWAWTHNANSLFEYVHTNHQSRPPFDRRSPETRNRSGLISRC